MQGFEHNLLGIGLYTVPEAERLTGVPGRRIRRWLRGYRYPHVDGFRETDPIWQSQIPDIDHTLGLGFLDLIEIRFVHAFRQHGVSWKTIRAAAYRAGEVLGQDHPFSTKRFKTDGQGIFAEIVEQTGETKLLDLVKRQYGFHKIIAPSLYAGLEFSDFDQVMRWYPMWPKQQVVIDPQRSFGKPIVAKEGVPTETLAIAARIEGSIDVVSRWYSVSSSAVRAAIAFEHRHAA